jgi:UDP-N-acetylglucosamine diphosphorylase/glucosamine-1-phosphate N-acetyltransferase
MKSDLPKVLHTMNGRPLLEYVVETAEKCGANPIIAIVGHKRELVVAQLGKRVLYAVQEPQLGTGHAVLQAEPFLKDFTGDILILSGDVPLLKAETIMKLLELHRYEGNACTLVTCDFSDPTGYGRIERDDKGAVINIIEHKDASKKQRTIKEINSGIYLVNPTPLFEALHTLKNNNAQGEYYLTDIVPAMLKKGLRVGGLKLNEPLEIAGVNSIAELEALEKEYLRRIKTKNI